MLIIKHLVKTYPGGKKAVDNLSLELMPGEIFGFIGHNGAGKTTTMHCVAGILDFDAGEITVNGCSIRENPVKAKQMMAFLPDNPDLYEFMTGIKYLNFIADMYDVPKNVREERIQRIAGEYKLLDALGNQIGSYSHGMKQKLALISAFIHQPKLLVLDEPFVGLDPAAAYTMKSMLRSLCNEGSTVFFSTHVLEVAQKLCDRIAIIRQGKLESCGKTQEIVGNSDLESVFLELEQKEEVKR